MPGTYNFLLKNRLTSSVLKQVLSFAPERSIPLLYKYTLRSWFKTIRNSQPSGKTVYLFADEFTNYNDVEIGIKAVKALNALGYRVEIPDVEESGRTYLSKGLIKKARKIVQKNIEVLAPIISSESPLIGIEPSAILTFKDEYIDLTRGEQKEKAIKLAENVMLFDDFIMQQYNAGKIDAASFTHKEQSIKLHGHCHQKALASTASTKKMLTLAPSYKVEEIKSGCCGMAGSFGFEKEHYEVSMKIGELVLFPEVRKTDNDVTIAAPGTSCRHQILEGTGKHALHPIEIFWESLQK